jgi:hypothetical protein
MPIAILEEINNLRDSTPDNLMEYSYKSVLDLSDSVVSTITHNA